ALEGGEHPGVAFGSGMAAIAAVFSFVPAGGTVVLPRHAYQVTLGVADDLATRAGVRVVRVDVADTDQVGGPLAGAALLLGAPPALVASPPTPLLGAAGLPVLPAAARGRGVLPAVDTTSATPLGPRPLDHGADVVVHSVTKYLAGHSDVVLGAAVARTPELTA